MAKSNIDNVLYNLSMLQYCHPNVFPNALSLLDHLFNMIGTDIEYDPRRGFSTDHWQKNTRMFITEKQTFSMEPIEQKREQQRTELNTQYERMKQIFGDDMPEVMHLLFRDEIEDLSSTFEVKEQLYYFNFSEMARELIDTVRAEIESDPHKRLQIKMPYPINDYSHICAMTRDDNPIMVRMAIASCYAWIAVLEYYIQSEWYYTAEEVEQLGPESAYFSLESMNKFIADFNRIKSNLEIQNA